MLMIKINSLIKKILKEVEYKVIPDISDQSFIILSLSIGTAKRGIDNFDQKIGSLTSENQDKMINSGVDYLNNKISAKSYIEKLEKVFSNQAKEKIKLQSSDVYKIISRLEGNKNVTKYKKK